MKWFNLSFRRKSRPAPEFDSQTQNHENVLRRSVLPGFDFKTVVDGGAFIGDWTAAARRIWPRARFFLFEPHPEIYPHLKKRYAGVPGMHLFQEALAGGCGKQTFYASAFAPSSSLLKMHANHVVHFPFTAGEKKYKVRTTTLDAWGRNYALNRPVLLKMDTQGYELAILKGADQWLRQADALLLETSYETLYHGQPLGHEVRAWLEARGFAYHGALDHVHSATRQRAVQEDSLFLCQNDLC